MDELEALHPFGQGNPEPVFGVRGVVLRSAPEVFKEQHFRFQSRGRPRPPAAWRGLENGAPAAAGGRAARSRGRADLESLQRPQAAPARADRLAAASRYGFPAYRSIAFASARWQTAQNGTGSRENITQSSCGR
jgi:hypothetical protein